MGILLLFLIVRKHLRFNIRNQCADILHINKLASYLLHTGIHPQNLPCLIQNRIGNLQIMDQIMLNLCKLDGEINQLIHNGRSQINIDHNRCCYIQNKAGSHQKARTVIYQIHQNRCHKQQPA